MSASVTYCLHYHCVELEIEQCFRFPAPDFFRIDTVVFHSLNCIYDNLFIILVCHTVPFIF